MRIRSRTKRLPDISRKLAIPEEQGNAKISDRLEDNEAALRELFDRCADFYIHPVYFQQSEPGLVAYMQGLVDTQSLDFDLLEPLLEQIRQPDGASPVIKAIHNASFSVVHTKTITELSEAVRDITSGSIVLMMQSSNKALAIKLQNKNLNRAVEEPVTEAVIRGPHSGFIENLNVNIALLRVRLKTPRLKVETFILGDVSHTVVAVAYMEGIAPNELIEEVKRRLTQIKIDVIFESGHIEEIISDVRYTPFPLMQMSERPDTVAALIYEGKAAIIVDGTPMVNIVPATFWQGFQIVEDYYNKFMFATAFRWLRFLFALLTLLMPSLYVAITTFHQEMIPTALSLSIAAARAAAPFPTMLETLMMEIIFEALREAGIRLPTPIGPTVSIVGALVIGQAAVQAGIISAPIVIVVALTGISSFLIPKVNMNLALRLLRFPVVIMAGLFGLFGIGAALLALLIHLVTLRSFGVPYLTPIAPFQASGLWDVLVRAPWWILRKRPHQTGGDSG